VVRKQREVGIDIPDDGEFGKPVGGSYDYGADYIEGHLAEHISLATLAQLVRLSPHYFCRAFKQSFGLPPHRYPTTGASSRPRCCSRGRSRQ
jgi:hypothetical protein